jgi:hypothetical protein
MAEPVTSEPVASGISILDFSSSTTAIKRVSLRIESESRGEE